MTPAGRIAASIELLDLLRGSSRPADAEANDYFRSRRFIGAGDRRAISDRVWQVLRQWRRLAWWLARAGAQETGSLLVAASMLVQGQSLAALSDIYTGNRFAPGRLGRDDIRALRTIEGHTLEHPDMPLPVRLEVPDWILPRLQARFGPHLEQELAALGAPAPLDLRVNLLKGTREQARAALAKEGLVAQPTPLSPWGLRVAGRLAVTSGAAFRSGLVEIQDEGSQLVAALLGAAPGMRVADWCAGAGGKTLAIAMTMENRGRVVACDVSAPRLDGAVRRLRRAGIHNVERHLLEPGDRWARRRAESFDRVLVDAPCTGTGTWRRNPDARLRLSEQDLDELLPKQAAILDAAQGVVRAGGRLVYATCSVLAEENEAQVSSFLVRHPNFRLVPLAEAWTLDGPPPGAGDVLALTPARSGTDGFFAAVLERAP